MSFASEPGRDDGSLPPVNVQIPDDARELARDVLAYHRELRAQRRRMRILRLLGPFSRIGSFRHGTIFPLIATCVAISMLAGAMLSIMTISPASAPTLDTSPPPVTRLPDGDVRLDGAAIPVRSLTSSVLVLIPPTCGCGINLESLAKQAATAHVGIYFVYDASTNAGFTQMAVLTTQYGNGVARSVDDVSGLLFYAFEPYSLTALLVHHDATVDIQRTLPPGLDLTPALRRLGVTH